MLFTLRQNLPGGNRKKGRYYGGHKQCNRTVDSLGRRGSEFSRSATPIILVQGAKVIELVGGKSVGLPS